MRNTLLILLLSTGLVAHSQVGVIDYLNGVEKNNKQLQATKQLMDARKISCKTGLTPENPFIEYGYMPGSNGSNGEKQVYGVSQAFNFPTVYFAQNRLASGQSEKVELEYLQYRQDILLDAKILFYEYVYLNKLSKEFKIRAANAERLYNSYQVKYKQGNASILEKNKAKIQNLQMQQDLKLLEQKVASYYNQLKQMNGGIEIELADTAYFEVELISIDSIKTEMMELLPEFQILESETVVQKMNLNLQKQSWIPEFVMGYEAEVEPDGTYGGVKAGISIPLWQDKNAVRLAKAELLYAEVHAEEVKTTIFSQTEILHQEIMKHKQMLNEYRESMGELMQMSLLDKALQLGQISVIEYFNELSFYYDITDHYLECEREYYLLLAKLYKYKF